MKRIVLVFGLIAGLIVSGFMIFGTTMMSCDSDFEGSMIVGYSAMLVAFSFVFVGIKRFRDKQNNGVITFGKAFGVGILITLIACTMYVVTWMFEYYLFIPDFMDKYADHVIKAAQKSGASAVEIAQQTAQMKSYKEMYQNPIMVVLLTYMEILPIGLLATLISAAILRKKAKPELPV